MIQVNELRINNYFRWNNISEEIDQVTLYNIHRYEDFNPITITKEWLLRLGFEQLEQDDESLYYYYSKDLGDDYYLDANYNSFDFILSLRSITNIMPDDVFYLPNRIKYVHQLQNLTVALNKETAV